MRALSYLIPFVALVGCGGRGAALAPGGASLPASVVVVTDGTADSTAIDPKEDSAAGLTTKQKSAVLTAVDDACGDAWCEGDDDWRFSKIVCNFTAKTCTITVQVAPLQDDPKKENWLWRSCKMTGLASYDALLDNTQSLQGDFYDKLDACMTKIEGSLPK